MNLPTNWDLRAAVVLALLALLPVAAYLVLQDVVVALSLVSVLVIGLALFLMFSPSEAEVRPTKG
jgi:hypothetical protein